jgi:excinuclease ABC subunit C
MDNAKRKTLKKSAFENIIGIGPAKAKALMSHFKTVSALRNAPIEEIEKVSRITKVDAQNIIEFFKNN